MGCRLLRNEKVLRINSEFKKLSGIGSFTKLLNSEMIRRAIPADLPVIMQIIKKVKQAMLEGGNPQWDSDYPGEKEYAGDIQKGELFVDVDAEGRIRGFMCVNDNLSKEYADVVWKTPPPSLCIHRLAVDTACRGQGIASLLFDFAEAYGRELGYRSMHIDTFTPNKAAQRLFGGRGYRFVGEISMKGRSIPYRCYEKEL